MCIYRYTDMGRIKQILRILFQKKDKDKQLAQQESARVKALNLQVKTLTDINNSYSEQILELLKEQRKHKKTTFEEQMLNSLVSVFTDKTPSRESIQTPKSVQPTPYPNKMLETGIQFTDEQITDLIKPLGENVLSYLARKPMEEVKPIIKSKIPEISDESIIRVQQIAGGLI